MHPDAIELIVDEPVAGHFYWILQKHAELDGKPIAIESAQGPMPSYSAAMMAGIEALQRRADSRGEGAACPVVTVYVDPFSAASPTSPSSS
ncbi:hypothetical protein LJR290_001075 [Variovorax sp. LjRoot290]|uniref:hypothetical protein n=1 Tax=unclassified Variovorax TaxID=663243 RepID=UPI000888D598|nr:hypothetical protein [Variovorax sp. CF079]SDE82844.1 hypothetical protein SAMN05444679_13347 [Variovorax sp. CF079]